MDAKDFAAACPLFERSQAADPSSGTLLNLGDCYEHLGRTASADAAFTRAIDLAKRTGHSDRVEVAEARRQRLADKLRRFRFLLPPASSNAGAIITLTIDQTSLASASAVVAVDPGTHTVQAKQAGYRDYVVTLAAPEPGTTLDVNIPEFERVEAAPELPPNAESNNDSSGSRSPALNSRRVAAIAVGAVGVVGVVTGTVFGLRSMSKHNESDDYCNGNRCSDQRGVDAMNGARTAGNISTVTFIVGGVGLGAAAALWFIRPANDDTGVRVGIAPGMLRLQGKF